MVLCSFVYLTSGNQTLKQLLLEKDEEKEIFLPDISYQRLAKFIDDIYNGLCSKTNDVDIQVEQDLLEVFGMLQNENTPYKTDILPHTKNEYQVVVENRGEFGQQHLEYVLNDDQIPESFDLNEETYIVEAPVEYSVSTYFLKIVCPVLT